MQRIMIERGIVAVGLLSVMLGTTLTVRGDGPELQCTSKRPVFGPEARPYGSSYETWVARYFQWSMAFPATANSAADTAPSEAGQPRGVWFLPSVTGSRTVSRTIEVPAHTPLFVSALAIRVNNTECPTDTEYTVDELFERAREQWSLAREASVEIDGVPVAGLEDPQSSAYYVEAGPFPFTLSDHDNQLAASGLTCVPDGATLDPNVVAGVFVMIRPLAVGSHTIRVRGVAGPEDDPAFEKDVTYAVEVVPRR